MDGDANSSSATGATQEPQGVNIQGQEHDEQLQARLGEDASSEQQPEIVIWSPDSELPAPVSECFEKVAQSATRHRNNKTKCIGVLEVVLEDDSTMFIASLSGTGRVDSAVPKDSIVQLDRSEVNLSTNQKLIVAQLDPIKEIYSDHLIEGQPFDELLNNTDPAVAEQAKRVLQELKNRYRQRYQQIQEYLSKNPNVERLKQHFVKSSAWIIPEDQTNDKDVTTVLDYFMGSKENFEYLLNNLDAVLKKGMFVNDDEMKKLCFQVSMEKGGDLPIGIRRVALLAYGFAKDRLEKDSNELFATLQTMKAQHVPGKLTEDERRILNELGFGSYERLNQARCWLLNLRPTTRLLDSFARCSEDNVLPELARQVLNGWQLKKLIWYPLDLKSDFKELCPLCACRFKERCRDVVADAIIKRENRPATSS